MPMILRNITCPRDKAERQLRHLKAQGCEVVMTTQVLSDSSAVDIWYRVTID